MKTKGFIEQQQQKLTISKVSKFCVTHSKVVKTDWNFGNKCFKPLLTTCKNFKSFGAILENFTFSFFEDTWIKNSKLIKNSKYKKLQIQYLSSKAQKLSLGYYTCRLASNFAKVFTDKKRKTSLWNKHDSIELM